MIGRGEALDRIGRGLRAGRGAFVAGAAGVGVSTVLRAVAEAERAGGRRVHHAVGRWPADADQGVVVVLDDVHLLDDAAAGALRDAVLNDGRVVVAGTTDVHRCPEAVTWLWTSGAVAWVDVAPLGPDEVAALVAASAGAPPDAVTVATLVADCAGLPALLVPAVDAALAGGALSVRTGCARLSGPAPTSPALQARVRALVARCTHPGAASALGLVCTAWRLPLPFPGVDPVAVTELVDRGLVVVGGEPAIGRPAARAVARVVQDDLGPGGLAATAALLLAGAGRAPDVDATRWRVLAGEEVEPADLVAAAGACRGRGELLDAESLCRGAAASGDLAASRLHAEVLAALGRRREAAEGLERVVAAGAGDPLDLAMCTLELATLLLWNLHQGDRAMALADELLSLPAPSAVVPRLRAAVASIHAYAGHPAAALERLGDLVTSPERYDDHLVDHVLAVARALRGACAAAVLDAQRGLARCTAASGPVPGTDPEIHVLSCTLAMGEAGLLGPAAALAAEWHGLALDRGLHVGWMALARARVALERGELDAAERFGREAEADFADLDNHVPRRLAVAVQLFASASCGEADRAVALQDRLDALGPVAVGFLEPEVERARAWALAATGSVTAARAHLDRTGRQALAGGLAALAMGAHHDAARMGCLTGAEAVRALAASVDGELAEVRVAHAAALLAGDAAGLLDAAERFAELGAHLCAADASAQAVERTRRRAAGVDPRKAMAACNRHRARCGAASTPALRALGTARLSGREAEVARLAAAGMASRAIGEQLGISVRTVDNLLQRAYAKLGVHDRAALAPALELQET